MRTFFTSVIAHKRRYQSEFYTEPYEVAWAGEAICFVRVEALSGKQPVLEIASQISADGIRWVDEGSRFDSITEEGDSFLRLSHFGGWLRFRGRIQGSDSGVTLTIHLVLKE